MGAVEDNWTYPFYEKLTLFQSCLFMGLLSFPIMALYLFGEVFTELIWGEYH